MRRPRLWLLAVPGALMLAAGLGLTAAPAATAASAAPMFVGQSELASEVPTTPAECAALNGLNPKKGTHFTLDYCESGSGAEIFDFISEGTVSATWPFSDHSKDSLYKNDRVVEVEVNSGCMTVDSNTNEVVEYEPCAGGKGVPSEQWVENGKELQLVNTLATDAFGKASYLCADGPDGLDSETDTDCGPAVFGQWSYIGT